MTDIKPIIDPIPSRFGGEKLREWHESIKFEGYPPLPVVDWASIGQSAPEVLTEENWDPQNPLPTADVVVMTWTSAEWAAMDHVFCDSGEEMSYYYYEDESWQDKWNFYSRGYDEIEGELPSTAPSLTHKAWGRFCRVKLPGNDKTVLLFKSDMHISTDGQGLPLRSLVQNIIDDSQPALLLTIGTAGGSRNEDFLGTTNITNAGRFDLSGDLAGYDFNHKTFSNDWTPQTGLLKDVQSLLMTTPVTMEELEYLAKQMEGYTLSQLINKEITPGFLAPKINVLDIPVLTTNGYEVGNTSGNYDYFACMEMDDAVIAMISDENNQVFGIVRNISDPVQNADLPEDVQSHWGSVIYKAYGLYTSYNGALATWAVLAAL